jgi:hypothetical protein
MDVVQHVNVQLGETVQCEKVRSSWLQMFDFMNIQFCCSHVQFAHTTVTRRQLKLLLESRVNVMAFANGRKMSTRAENCRCGEDPAGCLV